MTLDVRGSLKNTRLSSNQYVVFEELIANAIDAYLIRRADDPTAPAMIVNISVDFSAADLLGDNEIMSVSCTDNGCGLGDDQLKAFLTKDTSYKDDLRIAGIGKCKGAGRIQFFHHFAQMMIQSRYHSGGAMLKRELRYVEPKKQIEAEDFSVVSAVDTDTGTTIRLEQFKESVRARVSHGEALSSLFSAPMLRKQMLVAFLQRLVSLGDQLGEFEIRFTSRHWKDDGAQKGVLLWSELPAITDEVSIDVEERDPTSGNQLGVWQKFNLSHYKLDAEIYDLPRNAIAFCAKSSHVKDITKHYLRTRAEQNNAVGGFHHIVLIESDYLDERVNEQRDGFDRIPDEIPSDIFSSENLSFADIHDALDPTIFGMVTPADWRREEVLKEATEQFGISEAMVQDTKTRIAYGETAQSVAERVLGKYQKVVIDETAAIFSLKEEIINTEPDSDEFRQKIHELSWKYPHRLRVLIWPAFRSSSYDARRSSIFSISLAASGLRCKRSQTVFDGRMRRSFTASSSLCVGIVVKS